MAHLACAIVADLLLGEGLARFDDDDRQRCFAKEGVWHAYHLGIGNLEMAKQHLLELRRIEIFSATNDHLFEPTDNIDVPRRIHRG